MTNSEFLIQPKIVPNAESLVKSLREEGRFDEAETVDTLLTIVSSGKPHEINPALAIYTEFTLEKLLAGVTDDNLHAEIAAGDATGIEVW